MIGNGDIGNSMLNLPKTGFTGGMFASGTEDPIR